ncbi:flippase [candidate division WOR-3 bacterium]|nr:flippase [candidate division WOR-3 bacterium]
MKAVSRNFISLFLSDAVSRVFGFLATVYIARILTVEGFGLIHYGLAFLTYAMLLTNPGVTTIGAREIARDRSNTRIVFEILGLRITLSIVVLVLCGAGLLLIPGDPATKNIMLLYFIALIPFSFLLEFVFQGREEMEYIGVSRVLQSAAYVVFLVVLVHGLENLVFVPVSYLIGYGLATGFLIFSFFRRYHGFRIRFSFRFWRELLIVATPVGLATVFNQAALTLPPIILGIFHAKEVVGVYSASYKIIIMLLIIERVFHYVSFPVLSKQFASAPTKLGGTFSLLARIIMAITVPGAIGGAIIAGRLIALIYGPGYESAVFVLQLLLFYFMVAPLNSIFGYGLVAVDKQRRFLFVITITAFVNTVLIILLGIKFSAPGAAAALVISEIIGLAVMTRELKKTVSFIGVRYGLKSLIAALIMGVAMFVLRMFPLWIVVPVGFVVYSCMVFVLRLFTVKELKNLQRSLVA